MISGGIVWYLLSIFLSCGHAAYSMEVIWGMLISGMRAMAGDVHDVYLFYLCIFAGMRVKYPEQ